MAYNKTIYVYIYIYYIYIYIYIYIYWNTTFNVSEKYMEKKEKETCV